LEPKTAASTLIVPTLVPVVDTAAAGLAAAADGLDGVAAPPVWAHAEIIENTAIARTDRRNLLVIGSLKLLGT
jgi:hypothetical protein